ncbi:MAG: 50S ribosomal protein L17 [bacterium]|nr:50S ribosomal protein L17 [bacterium]
MRHRKKQVKLNMGPGRRASLLKNCASSVLLHERVRTTAARARAVQPLVERSITIGREATLVNRRALIALLGNLRAVAKVLDVIGPRYRARRGGCTRIIRLGQRVGDGAPMVQIELV